MRVVVAALFVIGMTTAAVVLLIVTGVIDLAPWVVSVVSVGLGLWMLLLCFVAKVLFNPWWVNPLGRMTPEEILRRLEAEGLLVSADFRVNRAFGVAEADDEGSHYFLELVDGRVLYLGGQYLYDYEPITEDNEAIQTRSLPCTDFTVRRHKIEGHVVEMVCTGTVIEPEFIAPPFNRQTLQKIGTLEDGQILSDKTYDGLKELLQGSKSGNSTFQ